MTSLYESNSSKPVEAPRTSLTQIGASGDKINHNVYNSVSTVQQDNSVKGEAEICGSTLKQLKQSSISFHAVNIQNFESRSPALSRNNSLRIKKDDTSSAQQKLSTGTRQLRDHELTYFGLSQQQQQQSKPATTTDSKLTKSSFAHLSTSKSSSINTSIKSTTNNNSLRPSTIIINHQKHLTEVDQSKPDLIMHHQRKFETSTPELSSSEKKSMIETLDNCIDETKNLEPLYENLYLNQKVKYDRKSDIARDEKILNELTRAADEIMNVSRDKVLLFFGEINYAVTLCAHVFCFLCPDM